MIILRVLVLGAACALFVCALVMMAYCAYREVTVHRKWKRWDGILDREIRRCERELGLQEDSDCAVVEDLIAESADLAEQRSRNR